MEDYVCVFNRIIISRGEGARISADWAEALYEKDDRHSPKGNRNAIEGKFFIGEGDVDGFACSDSDGTGQDIYVRFSLVYTKPAASP